MATPMRLGRGRAAAGGVGEGLAGEGLSIDWPGPTAGGEGLRSGTGSKPGSPSMVADGRPSPMAVGSRLSSMAAGGNANGRIALSMAAGSFGEVGESASDGMSGIGDPASVSVLGVQR